MEKINVLIVDDEETNLNLIEEIISEDHIDIFKSIIGGICSETSNEYGVDEKKDIAIRIIADHLRSVCFSIADGQIPENTGSGYVTRRILRRAIRYAFSYLGTEKPFIFFSNMDII